MTSVIPDCLLLVPRYMDSAYLLVRISNGIEYQGQPLSNKEVKRRQTFYDSIGFTCLMQFSDGRGIDGVVGGNESRFINHSTEPNVGALRESEWRILFYSLDDIAQGDELTFNYGFDPNKISGESLDSGRGRLASKTAK